MRRGNERDSDQRARLWRPGLAAHALGLGCLATLALLVVQRTNPLAQDVGAGAYKPFLASVLAGFACAGALGCLSCRTQTYMRDGRDARSQAVLLAAGCALAMGGIACRLASFDALFAFGPGSADLSGLACGAGLALLALP